MNLSRALWGLGIIIVIGVLAWGLSFLSSPGKHLLSGAPAADGSFEHTENGQFYHIDLKVPQKTPLWRFGNSAADAKARLAMEQVFLDAAAQFKKDGDVKNINLKDQPWMDGRQYEYAVSYAEFTSPHFVSYRFDIYEDTGGAHPNGFYRTFVFDKAGNEVLLPALFAPGADYVSKISAEARAQVSAELKNRLGPDAVSDPSIFGEGLAPKTENFQNFVLDEDTLRFFIPPYQAAAYAAGPFEVDIPLSDLAGMLAPDVP